MPIAVTEDHESLRATALRWAQTHCPATVPRQVAEAPPGSADLPAAWEKMAAQGWLGLHLSEEQGGQGFTLAELAVVLEELGHALFPGPLLPTLLVSAALARGAARAGGRAARSGCAGWPTAPSRPPWRWAQRRSPGSRRRTGRSRWRARCARCSGCPRPGWSWSRSTTAPARQLAPARPGGAGRRGRRRGAAGARRHPGPGPAHHRRRRPGHGAAGASRSCCPTTTCAAWP